MPGSYAQVAVQRERRGASERQGTLTAALAEDQGDVHIEVNIGHPQACDLATPGAGVEEEGDQRGWPRSAPARKVGGTR